MFKIFEEKYLKKCSDIFFDVYKNEPFNYFWLEYNSVVEYFVDMFKTPKFKGFVFLKNNAVVGCCLGVVSNYFKVKKYRIAEIFVDRHFQGMGIGTNMLLEIQKYFVLNNVDVIELTTDKNTKAFEFYRKNGYSLLQNNVSMVKVLKNLPKNY